MLCILDGWGLSDNPVANAVAMGNTPNFDSLWNNCPHTQLSASGQDVGLQPGIFGNSEVGHLNIGAGRIVWQDSLIIDQAIDDGAFFENETLLDVMRHAKENNTRLHLMGLISNGSVHSSETHYFALLEMAAREGLRADQVLVHAFTDGRDTAPRSARLYIGRLLEQMVRTGIGSVASVIGRYYAMDRDNRWERVQTAYDCLTQGKGFIARDAIDAVEQAYARDENDEFIKATVVLDTDGNPRPRIADNDAVLFFNYRSDRGRQLAQVFIDPEFDAHLREESQQPGAAESDHPPTVTKFLREVIPSTYFATMTRYAATLQCPIGFEPRPQRDGLGETVAKAGKTQLRIAETEKYPHVTYFFSGGMEIPWDGEERILVNSPKVATYDLQPQMSAPEVTEKVTAAIRSKQFDCIVLNYANPDMVGHTGIIEAAVAAVEEIDRGLGQVMQAIDEVGGALLMIADHGNCEQMVNYETGEPHTAHTTNPVPCILYGKGFESANLRSGGRLADVSPTLLALMQVTQPPAMTGINLLQSGPEQLVAIEDGPVSTERELNDAIAKAITSKQEMHRFYRMAGTAREEALQLLYARFAEDASTHARAWREQNPTVASTSGNDQSRKPNTALSDMEIVDATLQAESGLATHWQQLQSAAQLEETRSLFGELAREATSHIEIIQKVTGTNAPSTVTTGNEKE
jgi:2,3-bisphosphoglycerate-independent phosphoglycerate mutase